MMQKKVIHRVGDLEMDGTNWDGKDECYSPRR